MTVSVSQRNHEGTCSEETPRSLPWRVSRGRGGFRDVCFSLVPQVLLLLSKFGANTAWKKANDY